MMALALFVVIAAAVVSLTVGGESGRAAEGARKLPGEPSPYLSGEEEEGAAEKSPGETEPPRSASDEEVARTLPGEPSPHPSPDGGPAGQRKGEAKGPQQVGGASETGPSKSRSGVPRPAGRRTPSEAAAEPGPRQPQHRSQPGERRLPAEGGDWQRPTQAEIREANSPRHYQLLPGAIMALTIGKIGVYNAPVFDSDSRQALAKGVAHIPETSLPWSETPERNVYLAGHRMGFRGTWSRMLFYNLDELRKGDKIVLKDRRGRTYEYRVSETFLAEPADSWVMGRVRGRDMVTLQTCTPIPTFEKRLIVRADRV